MAGAMLGQSVLPNPLVMNVDKNDVHKLAKREFELLNLVANGPTNNDIDGILCIVKNTAEVRLFYEFGKLPARNGRQTIAILVSNNKLSLGYIE